MSKGLNQHTVRQSEGKAHARQKRIKMLGLGSYAAKQDMFTLDKPKAGSFPFPCYACEHRFQRDYSEICNGTNKRGPCGHLKGSF